MFREWIFSKSCSGKSFRLEENRASLRALKVVLCRAERSGAGEHALLDLPSKWQEHRTNCHGSVVCEPLGDKNAKIEFSRKVRISLDHFTIWHFPRALVTFIRVFWGSPWPLQYHHRRACIQYLATAAEHSPWLRAIRKIWGKECAKPASSSESHDLFSDNVILKIRP